MVKDSEHPFFRPLWRRIALVAVCLVWAGVEIVAGETMWALIAGGATCYAFWQFVLRYSPPDIGGKP